MNYFEVSGRTTGWVSQFLTQILKFKHIAKLAYEHDGIIYHMKNGLRAKLQFLAPGASCVIWSTSDFRMVAHDLAGENWELVYDVHKFQDALDFMIKEHDATEGINWTVIKRYLNRFCMKQNADLSQIVKDAIKNPNYSKLELIKLIKELTGWGLREAKDFVEKHS